MSPEELRVAAIVDLAFHRLDRKDDSLLRRKALLATLPMDYLTDMVDRIKVLRQIEKHL